MDGKTLLKMWTQTTFSRENWDSSSFRKDDHQNKEFMHNGVPPHFSIMVRKHLHATYPGSSMPKLLRWRLEVSTSSTVPSRNLAEPICTLICMVQVKDMRTSTPCHYVFRGPRSDYVRHVALEITL
ncbi:hypothetical protein TNCV_1838041 [Trichonephila clavipes]|nr:hypothetical protein TNCV_1838041 [Trichonephila clavipes]